jgi:hypothetical protein
MKKQFEAGVCANEAKFLETLLHFHWVLREQTREVPIDASRSAPQCMLAQAPSQSHSHDSVTSSPTSDWFVITFHK